MIEEKIFDGRNCMYPKLFKNLMSLASAELITKLFTFVITIIIARNLQDTDFGKYSFVLAFTSFFAVISDLGLSTLTIREVAKNKYLANKYFGSFFSLKILYSVATILLLSFLINILNYQNDMKLALYIGGAYVIVNSFNQFFISFFRAFERMEYETLVRILEISVVFFGTLYVIHTDYGLVEIVGILLFSSIFRFIISGGLIVNKFVKPELDININFIKSSVTEALPFGLTLFFVVIYFRIDTIMLSIMIGDAAVGWYNVAFNIVHGLSALIGSSIAGVSFPIMAKSLGNKENLRKVYITSFQTALIAGLAISILVTIYSEEIIQILYKNQYSNSIPVLKIFIWAFFIICISSISSTLLNSIHKQKIVTYGTLLGAVLNVTLNYILIPKYAVLGAVYATIATEMCGFAIYYYYCIKYLDLDFKKFNVQFMLIANENINILKNLKVYLRFI